MQFCGSLGVYDEMKNITKKILGVVLIVIGLIALVTPCSPGSWLALIGSQLLGFGVLLEKKLLPLLKPPQRRRITNLMQKVRTVLKIESPPPDQDQGSDESGQDSTTGETGGSQ